MDIIYYNRDTKKTLTEEEIRNIDFEENIQDLNNNKKDITEVEKKF